MDTSPLDHRPEQWRGMRNQNMMKPNLTDLRGDDNFLHTALNDTQTSPVQKEFMNEWTLLHTALDNSTTETVSTHSKLTTSTIGVPLILCTFVFLVCQISLIVSFKILFT